MLAVRPKYLVTGVLLAITPMLHGAPPPSASSAPGFPALAVVSAERIAVHDRGEPLDGICRVDHSVYACTDLVTERFDCRCEPYADAWRVVANIRVDFVIHVADPTVLRHEQLHIQDIETALSRKLRPLLVTLFDDPEGCAATARMMSEPRFATAVLNQLAAASNDALGCTLQGESKPKIRRRRAR